MKVLDGKNFVELALFLTNLQILGKIFLILNVTWLLDSHETSGVSTPYIVTNVLCTTKMTFPCDLAHMLVLVSIFFLEVENFETEDYSSSSTKQ